MKSIFFPFMDHVFGVIAKTSLLYGIQIFTPAFSFTGVIVLNFALRSVTHFELNFVYSARYRSRFWIVVLFFYDGLIVFSTIFDTLFYLH